MIQWAKKYHPDWIGKYVSGKINMAKRTGHSCGNAVDVTLVNVKTGKQIQMGTGFDDFSKKSWTFNAKGKIRKNRMFLYTVMKKYGFKNFYTEWWHYSYPAFKAKPEDLIIE
jgi:D-alanyl-D-alanine dipeptidase